MKVFKRLNEGAYFPSFFTAEVDTQTPMVLLDPFNSSPLYHEYTHFLQDLFTIHGNAGLFLSSLLRTSFVNEVKPGSMPPIKIKNQQYVSLDKERNRIFFRSDTDDEEPEFDLLGIQYDDPNDLYVYQDSNGRFFPLDGKIIDESMADALEQKHPDYVNCPNKKFPYKVIESLFKNKITNNHPILIAWICFTALNCQDPRKAIYEIYNSYQTNLNNACSNDFFAFIQSHSNKIGFDLNTIQDFRRLIIQELHSWNKIVPNMGKAMLGSINVFNPSTPNGYIEILDYFKEVPDEKNKSFFQRTSNIGLPLYRNKKGEYSSFGFFNTYGSVMMNFVTLRHIIQYWLGNDTDVECPLFETCKLKSKDFSCLCKKRPWKLNKKNQLCSYSAMWKTL